MRLITGFDHVVIAVNDMGAAVSSYATLLGRRAEEARTAGGVATALIPAGNIAVELMAPVGEGETASRLRAVLADGEGLKSLAFAVSDIEAMHRRLERVGLEPEPVQQRDGWRSVRAHTGRTRGVRVFLLQRDAPQAPTPEAGTVLGLDHIVVRSGDADAAAALYGARLGLDMRLDRMVAGRRLMFFRCGDAIVEIAHEPGLQRDALWGLSWRVADADAARARLADAGFAVSEVRAGAKPGTRVFTVRDGACGVPTLMIETSQRRD